MNRNLARTPALSITLLIALALTGCTASRAGDDPEHALHSEWVATSEGDVNCLTTTSKGGYTTYDCNWNTLTTSGTHTTENSRQPETGWTHTDQGKVYCIRNYTKGGYRNYSCNWNDLR